MNNKRTIENAHKFLYLIQEYPEKTMTEVVNLFQLPPVETNTAIWYLQDKGYITIEQRKKMIDQFDDKGEKIGEEEVDVAFGVSVKSPKAWKFGEHVETLMELLEYAFQHINKDGQDMEENYLASWSAGYFPQDVLIAVKQLIGTNVLHEYTLQDNDNEYIFYTLKANAGKEWGKKQFKQPPVPAEDSEEAAEAQGE